MPLGEVLPSLLTLLLVDLLDHLLMKGKLRVLLTLGKALL